MLIHIGEIVAYVFFSFDMQQIDIHFLFLI